MLGCYVSPVGVAAKGVPERFLRGDQTNFSGNSKEGRRDIGDDHDPTAREREAEKEKETVASGNNDVPAPASAPVTVEAITAMDIDKK